MFDIFNIKKQKLVVSNSSSTTTLKSQSDITAQKSIESIVNEKIENNVISVLGFLITGPVRPILTVSIIIGKLSLNHVIFNYL